MKLTTAVPFLLSLARVKADTNIDPAVLEAAAECNQEYDPLIFVILEDEAVNAAIEDDIRNDLAKIGFKVEKRELSKPDINVARQTGNFHFSITETWGTPYDPSSYASGWIDGNGGEGVFPSMVNLEAPSSRTELLEMVTDVLQQENPKVLDTKWANIHRYYHEQAFMLPLYGKRIPTLLHSRLSGYQPGYQQFDYPVHTLVPAGSSTVKIAPGARTGLFKTVGTLNAHVYGPNEFFSNNWVYEGLVHYGANGRTVPALALEWDVTPNDIGGDDYTFQLRQNVTFHDGAEWNCDVAKLNFDHIFTVGKAAHDWYGVGLYTKEWFCNGEYEFVIRTDTKHGPYLQELTFIRPVRMISPNAFPKVGNESDPLLANTCHLDWGIINNTDFTEEVNCVGIESIAGTGPFQYNSRMTVDGVDQKVVFTAHEGYWDGASKVERLEIVRYATSGEVKEALINGDLDAVWGSGVLSDADIVEIRDSEELQGKIQVFHSNALQNVILLLNTGNPPFDDINVRKTVIHAINKGEIVRKELKGLQTVVDNIFPLDAPHSDIDLTPRWDYDIEKAVLLSYQQCNEGDLPANAFAGGNNNTESTNNALAIGLGVGLGILALILAVGALIFYKKQKKLEDELEVLRKNEMVDA